MQYRCPKDNCYLTFTLNMSKKPKIGHQANK